MAFKVNNTAITSILNAGFKTGRDSENLIDFATTDNKLIFRVNNVNEVELVANVLQPTTNDGVALGTASLGWSDLHLASAGVINWANGEMTITESDANTLTVAGGTLATAAMTGTTIDATTDFTIGSTIITDGVITDSSGLRMTALVGIGTDAATYGLSVFGTDANTGAIALNNNNGGDAIWRLGVLDSNNFKIRSITGSLDLFELSPTGAMFIGDTANDNMTVGLTINQGAADDSIMAFKSSDVGHVMTGVAEADTFGSITKAQATSGGLVLNGYKDTAGIAGAALQLTGNLGEAVDTASSTSAYAVINFIAKVTNGSTGTALVADAGNMASFANGGGATRWLIKGNGDTWQNGNLVLGDAANVSLSTPLLAGADHTTTGITAEMLAGGAIAAFDLVCIHTTTQEIVVADASAVATAKSIGIAPVAISDTATGTVLLHGFVRDDTWNWTTGATLYLSETAGAMTETAPTTSGAFVQPVGIALEPDVVYINPDMTLLEVS